MIKQDNKLIFDIDKKYVAGKATVWNNVKRKQLLLNKNIVVYAYIKEIEYNTNNIKVKLNSTDDTETIITLDKTATDNTGIPEYTTPDAKTDELNYALTLFVNEAYKDFQAGTNITPPPAVDVSEYELRIQELTEEIETLTGQLEEAQSQTSSTAVQDYQKFTVNNTEYNIRILGNDTSSVFFMFYTDDTPVTNTLSTIGFSSQQGAALFKNTTDNTSIQFELYIDGTLQSNAGGVDKSKYFQFITTSPAVNFTADKPVCVKITIKDSNDEVVSTAYDQFTYTPRGGGVVDNRDTTTMQLINTNLNGYIQIKCMVQNSTRPISGTIDLYAGNTYLDTVTLDNNNYVDYTPELEPGTYTFTGYYYGSNEYKPCTSTLSNVEIT